MRKTDFARGLWTEFVGENKLGDQYKGGVDNSSLSQGSRAYSRLVRFAGATAEWNIVLYGVEAIES